jgi:glyoxylase-like metal-dependent hydrolase (beta-lactamase superfamily II)
MNSGFLQNLFVGLAMLMAMAWPPAAAEDYKLEPVRGNVYRFSAGHYHSVSMVTDEGIVVADPINAEAAAWLRKELARRFNRPIRFVIYSHNHPDHIYGGESLDDGKAQFVAHRLARKDLIRTKARTRIPDIVFKDEMSLHLGDSRVRLRYHGPNNGLGSISMLFEPAGVLHVVDWITLGRLPWKDLQGYDINGMINSTHDVLDMDFAVFVGGHGDVGSKQDVRRYLGYLEALYGEVRDGMLAGMDLRTLQRSIHLEKYRDLKMHREWLPLNIEGVYRTLADQSYLLMRPDVKQPSSK